MLFDSWHGLARVVIVGVLAYAALVLMLRASGKRTLGKMNAFDLVVTVALGSTLATVIISKQVALAEGVLALAVLILLQFVITWLSVRSRWVRGLAKAEPTLVARDGALLPRAMRTQRVTADEIDAALRDYGYSSVEQAGAVVLETDGSLSVIPRRS